jgi:hypothetical protein
MKEGEKNRNQQELVRKTDTHDTPLREDMGDALSSMRRRIRE